MIHLNEEKRQTEGLSIQKAKAPGKVHIPLSQHMGKICQSVVKAGDPVKTGQLIATLSEKALFSPIHSSVSGKVKSINDYPHPVLGTCKAIAIESDGLDTPADFISRKKDEIEKLSADLIRTIIFDAGIVGMGGASFPTHIKLSPPKPVDSLILNGAECEPYLTSDSRLMIEKTKEILLGLEVIARCTGVKKVYIAIEDNKPEAIKHFKDAIGGRKYIIRVIKSAYPQGGEKQLIKAVLKREVPSGKLPFDVGALVQNVATTYAVYEAVYLGKPLYERVVTVTGDCLERPANLLTRIGTPIKELIEQCGPLKKEPKKIVFGGPMMGIAQYSLEVPVIKSTNGIILLSEGEIDAAKERLCIRCARCVEYCPLGLMPCMMSLASEKEKWDLAKAYGCLECMECGACNYVCPQKRNIVQAIKYAKTRIPK
ncbi:MAG: electron transport complex subunit RsxC [Candidatus Omnitrophica bacterium]|nr:electron transport complex subunit RsxC [Candidatus Omnitrophota bacterium]MBU4488689.1 electron transport complex subunit RsxC [Candidatus Omnitrophota bacterium]MCG2705718.1 electron transport complex subunit RsxC [Candidatus Omnitrophota bacterium]